MSPWQPLSEMQTHSKADASCLNTLNRIRHFPAKILNKQQQMIGMIAEEFMRKRVLPRSDEIYSKDWNVTRQLLMEAGELGLLSIDVPEQYGGLGLDKVSSAHIGEQLGLMPSFGASLGAHTSIGTLPIVYFRTEEQKSKYLPRLSTGELVAAYALTETGSGSDALAAKPKPRSLKMADTTY